MLSLNRENSEQGSFALGSLSSTTQLRISMGNGLFCIWHGKPEKGRLVLLFLHYTLFPSMSFIGTFQMDEQRLFSSWL